MIPYGRQDINQTDIDEVVGVLKSDFLTQGPAVPRFEEAVANYSGSRYAVAVNSATSALHIACLALGLGPGDRLWTSPITFVASANCALYCGASVDFVDIDSKTYNLCPQALESKLIDAERQGRLPKIVVPVHLCGQSCDMAAIHALSQRYGFKIIEDASHAIGGKYKGEYIGNSRYSDITVFSFHPVKIITTAEGGMAMTNDPVLAENMLLLRSHGITRDPVKMTHEPDGPWYYQQIALGFNYRLTDLQAALGLSQLARLEIFVERRRYLAARYDSFLEQLPVSQPWQHPECLSARHLYVIRVQDRNKVFHHLREAGIGANVHYIPVNQQPYYQSSFGLSSTPEADRYYREAISIPLYSALTQDDQDAVIDSLTSVLSGD
jgi:UDP-4-amino-4,6-dideoxy-N-acetyl-beta-L-altrosamine transaminase